MEKNFDFTAAEKRLYEAWEQSGAFKPAGTGEPFTIVIPPPNVTGSLHMGHALNNTLQDILCRFERMRGKSVLWQPGMDHAGIATQMVVERQMMERQEKRTDYSRDAFVEKVWEWKEESGGQIFNQLRRLGASCDWSRERFTMGEGGGADDQMVQAVLKVFVQLYNDGLIYRDKRLVNWDPKFETAISDLEVENREVDGHFWHFKYPLEGGETYEYVEKDEDGNVTLRETRDYISIATTRPETMLGDGAVAVHPDDARYAPIVGKKCMLPLCDRAIPIITDDYPDPDFGSGAVKITGAHDFNDYQVAKRNDIAMYDLMDSKACLVREHFVPEKYRGMDRYDARKAVVADIDAQGLLIAVEDKKVMQPFGDRSGVVIEPIRTDQWYVNAEELAKDAIKAVDDGKTRFIPENWSKTYYQWMNNIEPWCISRQLWWGHRIPAWYGPGGEIFVAETEEEVIRQARLTYNVNSITCEDQERLVPFSQQFGMEARTNGEVNHIVLHKDNDVLDTWFSSGLWPFSTMGWPGDNGDSRDQPLHREGASGTGARHEGEGGGPSQDGAALWEKRYPTSTLVTAHDIIFFWVARMMMQGLYVMDDVPFKDVYIHGLVVDEQGQKMSKSKGNGVDPLELIGQYGADALRFSLAAQAAQGRNVRISAQRVEGYRNFTTKLWNAARFCEMNECKPDAAFNPANATEALSQWIVHEANQCAHDVKTAMEAYRFNDASSAIYKFAWNIFCDWHVELAKPIFFGDDGAVKTEIRAATAWAFDQLLKLLHPFMPFVTEELWRSITSRDDHLMVTHWPTFDPALKNDDAAAQINWAIGLITAVRSVRAEMNVPAGAQIVMLQVGDDTNVAAKIDTHQGLIGRLARVEKFGKAADAPKGSVQLVHEGVTFALPLGDVIDIDAEKARLQKEIDKTTKEITGIDKKLANKNFVDKAPAKVVEEQHTRKTDFEAQLEKLNTAFARLEEL